MRTRLPKFAGSVLIAAAIGSILWVNAGSLTPPGGPVAPTMKTLTEVEPRIAINATNTPGDADSIFKITLPGSYYLTGNITGVAGKHGIEIAAGGLEFAAGGVTLDLNGFDLLGFVGGTLDGVSATLALQSNIAVVNGSVRGWGDEGVDLGTLGATNSRVEGVLASGNAGNGITVGVGCAVSNCSAFSNSITGISVSTGSTVTNCSAYLNTGHGIATGQGSTVTNCSAYQNTINGIFATSGSTVTSCSAFQNISSGFSADSGSTVTNCSAFDNNANGITVGTGVTVADCTARTNTLDGIACSDAGVIRGNTCSTNGNGGNGAGIHATGNDNRIEGNTVIQTDFGILLDASVNGNLVVRNHASGNTTNYSNPASGNFIGTLISTSATMNAATNSLVNISF